MTVIIGPTLTLLFFKILFMSLFSFWHIMILTTRRITAHFAKAGVHMCKIGEMVIPLGTVERARVLSEPSIIYHPKA